MQQPAENLLTTAVNGDQPILLLWGLNALQLNCLLTDTGCPDRQPVSAFSILFAEFAMLELHDSDAEAITGGSRHSLANIIVVPQTNVAVNLVLFGGSITNGQGNLGIVLI
jgi:hypothetical protein